MIAFLGMGLLGANFVRALRRRGESVQVWNRSAAKARALAETGAVVRDTPADTVRGARLVHLTLSDDAVVDDVGHQAGQGILEPQQGCLDFQRGPVHGSMLTAGGSKPDETDSRAWASIQARTRPLARPFLLPDGRSWWWWRWRESNPRPKALHLRHYMLSPLFDLGWRQHNVRSTPPSTPALG